MFNALVIPYAFDSKHQVFSHQVEVVNRLRCFFDKTTVLADSIAVNSLEDLQPDSCSEKTNLTIIKSDLGSRFRILNAINFVRQIDKIIVQERIALIFFFMTDTHAAIAGPLVRLKHRNVKQVLWYAHANKSIALRVAYRCMDLVLSSTKGSMPLRGKKIRLIGQMIDEKKFPLISRSRHTHEKLVYIGRLDVSKNLNLILGVFRNLRESRPAVSLSFFGAPIGTKSSDHLHQLKIRYKEEIDLGLLSFHAPVDRDNISKLLQHYDIFVHAFHGSLDKAILEATLCGIPVATINLEYQEIFGSWSSKPSSLLDEIMGILSLPQEVVMQEIMRRRALALKEHSLENWISCFEREVLS